MGILDLTSQINFDSKKDLAKKINEQKVMIAYLFTDENLNVIWDMYFYKRTRFNIY